MVIGERGRRDPQHVDLARHQPHPAAVAHEDPVEALGRTPAPPHEAVGVGAVGGLVLVAQGLGDVDQTRVGQTLGAAPVGRELPVKVKVPHPQHSPMFPSQNIYELLHLPLPHARPRRLGLAVGDTDPQQAAALGQHHAPVQHALALEPVDAGRGAEGLELQATAQGQVGPQRQSRVAARRGQVQAQRRQGAPPGPPQLLHPDDVVGGVSQVVGEQTLALRALAGGRPRQAPQVQGQDVQQGLGHGARSTRGISRNPGRCHPLAAG